MLTPRAVPCFIAVLLLSCEIFQPALPLCTVCSVHWLLEEYKSTYRRLKDQLGLFPIFKTSWTGTTYTVMVDYIRFFFIDLGTSITSILYSCPVFGGNLSNMRVMIATHSAHVLSDT